MISRLRSAKGLIDFLRSGKFFKNLRLKNFLSEYYRPNASIGNGSSADALIYEATTGHMLSPTGHYQKVQGAKAFFTKLLNSSPAVLTEFEKQFIVRQLLEANRSLRIADKAGFWK